MQSLRGVLRAACPARRHICGRRATHHTNSHDTTKRMSHDHAAGQSPNSDAHCCPPCAPGAELCHASLAPWHDVPCRHVSPPSSSAVGGARVALCSWLAWSSPLHCLQSAPPPAHSAAQRALPPAHPPGTDGFNVEHGVGGRCRWAAAEVLLHHVHAPRHVAAAAPPQHARAEKEARASFRTWVCSTFSDCPLVCSASVERESNRAGTGCQKVAGRSEQCGVAVRGRNNGASPVFAPFVSL